MSTLALLLATASLMASPAAAPRATTTRIIESLTPDRIAPDLPPAAEPHGIQCLRPAEDKPIPSPFSPLPAPLRPYHRRIALAAGGLNRFEMRDALVLPVPVRLTVDLLAPADARLELGYRLGPCVDPSNRATLTVRAAPEGGTPSAQTLGLEGGPAHKDAPWRELSVPLRVPEGARVRLELEVTAAGSPTTLLLAEPVVTGLATQSHPNLLFVIVDALRADQLGATPSHAPVIDALAARGARFDQAFSVANQTRPSTLALMTGLPPTLGRFHNPGWVVKEPVKEAFYGSDPPLLSRILRRSGYRVATFGDNRYLFGGHPMALDPGFDQNYDDRRRLDNTVHLTDKAIRYLSEHRDDRWFLYFNLTTPHLPYKPPPEHLARAVAVTGIQDRRDPWVRYVGDVLHADAQIGRLLEHLKELGLMDRTLIVLTADHGEVFSEHHKCWSVHYGQTCRLNHGITLYDEEVHVPLVMTLPGVVPAGGRIARVRSHLQVAPTILDLLGFPKDPEQVGRSLRADLEGAPGADQPIYLEGRAVTGIRANGLKLILHHPIDDPMTPARVGGLEAWVRGRNGLGTLPLLELFDLEIDPGETTNLALTGDPRAAQMQTELARVRQELMAARAEVAAPPPGPLGPIGAATNQVLFDSDGSARQLRLRIAAPDGTVRCGSAVAASCVPLDGALGLEIELELGSGQAASFVSEPWDAPLQLEITVDGSRWETDRLRLGPYGLKLLGQGEGLDTPQRLKRAAGVRPPLIHRGREVAVYLWRDPPPTGRTPVPVARAPTPVEAPPDPSRASYDADDPLTPELQRVLKELGYSQ
jgi:arylsulfatase A-like enzyme